MGFSDLGSYGGEIHTPVLDSLANAGIRFRHFYNFSKCSPSRASLLCGMYPHKAGIGRNIGHLEAELTPGPYQGYLSDSSKTVAEWLKETGYATGMFGKWHVGERQQHWPRRRGFDQYFGLISGASSYFELIKNQKRKRQMVWNDQLWEPTSDNFYMTNAITDSTVNFIKKQAGNPYFIYVAYTAPHWPLHALEKDIEKYKGAYDQGWPMTRERRLEKQKKLGIVDVETELSPLPDYIPNWNSVEDKSFWARRMEVYAAMVDRMDQGIGKILKAVKNPENTLVVFLSDNGGSHEDISGRNLNDPNVPIGAKGSYVAYREPWALVSNTPFRKHKLWPYEGGISTPCIISFPKRQNATGSISDFKGHVMDLAPTILKAAQVDYLTPGDSFKSIEGMDLLPLLSGEEIKRPEPLFYEYSGRKAVIDGKWKILSDKEGPWELYDLSIDRTEENNLAAQNTQILDSLVVLYRNWATAIGADQ